MPLCKSDRSGHNGALLGTEFSHTTLTPANARLIPSISPPLSGRLLRHVAKLYWTVEVQHTFLRVFLLFCDIPVYILLRSNPSKQHSKVLYRWGDQKKRKDRKLRKRGSEEKVVGFSSASLVLARKREAVT